MNLTVEFKTPVQTSSFDWQLSQEINVSIDGGNVIAKAEIELLTLNKHRDALASYQQLDNDDENTDWEIPLNLYFKGPNLSPELCDSLDITPNIKKAQTHIMLEAISVLPDYKKQGIAQYLLQEIAKQYSKAQSFTVLSMPMHHFVDPEHCAEEHNKAYYELLNLNNEQITQAQLHTFFTKTGFIEYNVDATLLAEPLNFDIFVASPQTILKDNS
ncbi:MAG: GNAT superfamily N-acetyltransferase [Alteromonadaceae bacterium]|jgi:GNAT superfamily N-acetyltransferase